MFLGTRLRVRNDDSASTCNSHLWDCATARQIFRSHGGRLSTTVLIAEVFEPIRQMLAAMLSNMPNIRVICEVADGRKAVEKAKELHPDLILLDIGLPRLNGFDAARQIRRLSPQSKIIFVSQDISPEAVQEAFEAGASGYVQKLDSGRELVKAVEAVLRDEQFLSSRIPVSATADRRTTESHVPLAPPRQKLTVTPLHDALFYSNDATYLDTIANFVGSAVERGDAVIVALTKGHRDGVFERFLQADGIDIAAASEQGQFISLDPSEMLSTFIVNGLPDRERFLKYAGDVIMSAANALKAGHNTVALCGEGAPLLWSEGNATAAIQLEQLWNEVARSRNIRLLCAYPLDSFLSETGGQVFEKLCAEHSAVSCR